MKHTVLGVDIPWPGLEIRSFALSLFALSLYSLFTKRATRAIRTLKRAIRTLKRAIRTLALKKRAIRTKNKRANSQPCLMGPALDLNML